MTPKGHFETNWPLVGANCWVQHRKYISVRGTKQICSTTLFQAKYIMLVSGPVEATIIWVVGKAVPTQNWKKGWPVYCPKILEGQMPTLPAHFHWHWVVVIESCTNLYPFFQALLSDPPTPTLQTKGQRSKARKCWCQWLQMLYATTPCTPKIVINVGSKIIFDSIISVLKVSFLTTML